MAHIVVKLQQRIHRGQHNARFAVPNASSRIRRAPRASNRAPWLPPTAHSVFRLAILEPPPFPPPHCPRANLMRVPPWPVGRSSPAGKPSCRIRQAFSAGASARLAESLLACLVCSCGWAARPGLDHSLGAERHNQDYRPYSDTCPLLNNLGMAIGRVSPWSPRFPLNRPKARAAGEGFETDGVNRRKESVSFTIDSKGCLQDSV